MGLRKRRDTFTDFYWKSGGAIFFERIQRKGNQRLVEEIFQVLIKSIELEQVRLGVLQAPDEN